MKIGIDGTAVFGERAIKRYTYNLIKYLSEIDNKNEYSIFYIAYYEEFRKKILNFQKENFKNIVCKIPGKIIVSLWNKINYPYIEYFAGDIDMFHSTNFDVPATKKTKGEILVFIDDDVRLGSEKIVKNFLNVLNSSEEVGLVGASCLLPKDANYFQKISAKQISRSYFPEVHRITESDMVTHSCMAMKKEVYEEVGGESDYLVRGTDPDLRYRLRKKGHKIVIAPETIIYHPMHPNLKELIKKSFKNGIGSAWVFKNYPEKVYEAPGGKIKNFKGRRSFIYRWPRRIFDLIFSLITFKLIRFTYDLFYIIGYIYGLILPKEKIEEFIF